MKLGWFAVAVVLAEFGLGCSHLSGSPPATSPPAVRTSASPPPAPPTMDTFRAALRERDELERMYLFTSFLRTLRPENVQPVLAEVEKYRAGISKDEVFLLMYAWTRFDGPGAFATARDWPTPWSSVLMEQAMHAWGFNDGRAAVAACERIEDEVLRESLRTEAISGWVGSKDRLGASEFAATVPDVKRRNRLAMRLANEAKRDGPDAIIAWSDAVPADAPNNFKANVFSAAAGALVRLDTGRVADWYEGQMKHAYSSAALRNISAKWAKFDDSKSLLLWVETLPIEADRESERVDAFRTAVRIWASKSPAEAEAWLKTTPPGAARDGAIDEFAKVISATSPATALRWSAQIVDEDLRRKRILRYTRRWSAQDPAAVGAWVAEADIPAGWREQILNNLAPASKRNHGKNAKNPRNRKNPRERKNPNRAGPDG